MSAVLLSHLLAEKSCVEEFLGLLDDEAQAMQGGLFVDLGPLTERKIGLLDRMAALDRAREAAQVAMGFEPGRAGADAAAGAAGDTARQTWAELLALAERAKSDNRRNGTMLHGQLDFTRDALHYLQATALPFYGPDGVRKAVGGVGTRLARG
ncbi:flagella synthesis protein FlgN [Variovorax sp. KK3]|uniref:flagella synthesis protein FlgN n=1 Tax=Variovorax sp. KK3 TaxID=1855728 RepID=UPI0021187238|nr:flagellar protein FlgN [Variovorax sp. KK3]